MRSSKRSSSPSREPPFNKFYFEVESFNWPRDNKTPHPGQHCVWKLELPVTLFSIFSTLASWVAHMLQQRGMFRDGKNTGLICHQGLGSPLTLISRSRVSRSHLTFNTHWPSTFHLPFRFIQIAWQSGPLCARSVEVRNVWECVTAQHN